MKKEQIKQYQLKLNKLRNFFDGRDRFTQNEIIDWVAECTATFTDIGVNESVISKFLEFFSIKSKKIEFEYGHLETFMNPKKDKYSVAVQTIGAFEQEVIETAGLGENGVSNMYKLTSGLYYARVAYSTAQAILKRKLDEERLVPRWLLNVFSENEKFSNLFSSLELIESNYQDKDADGI
ncbi:MAG: hypothetical protein AAB969_04385, partial [Patescibacteria group bacterium]